MPTEREIELQRELDSKDQIIESLKQGLVSTVQVYEARLADMTRNAAFAVQSMYVAGIGMTQEDILKK